MSDQLPLNLKAGRRQKERGLDKMEGTHPDFVPRLRSWAIEYAKRQGSVTSDDVRFAANHLGLKPRHKNAWGAIFRGKGWVKVGEQPSRISTNNAHVNPVWAWRGDQ